MSAADDHETATGPAPHRAGAAWSPQDTATLLDGLRNGVPVDDLAETLQRTTSAIQARCKNMLPPDIQTTVLRAEADLVLRDRLATDPEFDPAANLDANLRRKWNTERDEILIQGWGNSRPMAELVAAVDATEIDIAGRCIRLGLAPDSLVVAERLGCVPDGGLDLRCRMMRDRTAASVWVLVIDGLPDGLHISLHATPDDAHAHFAAVTAASAPDDAITATVAQRTLGSPHGPVETWTA
ncbi:hypothetical protein NQK81_02315 [Amycolatopsis roodepoortensis]|uniref:hypothetical protein n=1 Tax=Amycolatopsis roodepoortensis TaxID=700274 RepID=UPI00214A8BAE|nr:hypothetical protein [Amycolatopsis roodepoortensis]UUV32308.1 hypothetical protein NQK81_02315 [Amycolatopsis roodepoortensis]